MSSTHAPNTRGTAHQNAKTQVWEAVALGGALAVGLALRSWNLSGHGFGNFYYSPAVLSMASGWHDFFYASFDKAGFLAIGKPPLAFWIQALSVRVFGFNALSIHLPQVLAGGLSVALVYWLARRVTGIRGAAIAALIAATTPASVAVDRSNLADPWLLLALLGAAALTLRAGDTGHAKHLVVGFSLVGVGFTVKLSAAFIAIPALVLTYALAAPISLRRRGLHLGLALGVAATVSLAWPAAVDLTPRAERPYVAETIDSSMVGLAFGLQGFQRIASNGKAVQCPVYRPPPDPGVFTGHGGRPGPLRLANRDMAGHITWFLPVILVGSIAMIRRHGLRTVLSRHDFVLWIAWLATFAAVFSLPRTFIHPYYLTMLTPAVAILAAVASEHLWSEARDGGRQIVVPVVALVLTLLWHIRILDFYPPWSRWLVPGIAVAAVGVSVSLSVARTPYARAIALAVGGAAAFVVPSLWSATAAMAPVGRMVPVADPTLIDHARRADGGWPREVCSLVRFLQANRGGERFLLAVRDTHQAAPIILESREAVMAWGGFSGWEPAVTVEEFASMVSRHEVRYVLVGGELSPADPIDAWVRSHATPIPQGTWRQPRETTETPHPMPMWGPTAQIAAMVLDGHDLYDCRAAVDSQMVRDRAD